jgi:cell division protease FtsH
MVSRWGMSAEVGPIDLRISDDHPFLGLDITRERQFSERTAYEVDQAVKKLMAEAANRAIKLIQSHRSRIETLVAALEENEVLDAGQIGQCLGRRDGNVAITPTAAAGDG